MINSKEELAFYIREDMKRNLKCEKFTFKMYILHKYRLFIKSNGDMAYHYLKSLRKLEYAENCLKEKSLIGTIIYRIRIIKFARLSYKYNITLHPNTIGYGLYLPHIVGGVIINCISMGNYCAINANVLVGNKHTAFDKPSIGNHVDLTTGCKLIGPITIGDNSIVAPNSVVVKDVPEGAVVSGIPAKILKIKE